MLTFIVNPIAGRGAAKKAMARVSARMDALGDTYETLKTAAPGHAETLAKDASARGADTVFAVGGDGTVLETARGLMGTETPLAVLPCGTGNDLVKTLGAPSEPVSALEWALGRKPRRVDAGLLNGRVFLNECGAGFDVAVLEHTLSSKKVLPGKLAYLYGVLKAIATYTPISIDMELADGTVSTVPITVLSVANGRWIGGGLLISPDADLADGLFDVLTIPAMGKRDLLFKGLPRLLAGKVLDIPGTKVFRCTKLTVRSPGLLVNIDGEIERMDEAAFRIAPGALWVRA